MLTGFAGHLVSEAFLEEQIDRAAFSRPTVEAKQVRAWIRRCRVLGPASGLRALVDIAAAPLVQALGFHAVDGVEFTDRTASALLAGVSPPVRLLVTHWGERLDGFWRQAVIDARQVGAGWCLMFNGTHLRLVDARRLYSRRYAEFDIPATATDSKTLSAFGVLCAAAAFRTSPGCAAPVRDIVDASDRHAAAVSRSLKDGVLSASSEILQAIVKRPFPRSLDNTLEQALTIVYRMLFLFFAEARGLVPVWHPVYRESYSLEGLQREAASSTAPAGLWDGLRAIARMAHAGCQAGDLRVTPFNGRLFAPAHTPLTNRRDLDDGAARRAILALSTRTVADRAATERIAYRDLGVEQLGAVYETLLDYTPGVKAGSGARRSPSVSLEPGSGVRKSTGTFYTPQAIAQFLVHHTLQPLVADASPERVLALRVLDPAMGSGAFLVAACSFLTEAYEAALVRCGACHASDIGPAERVTFRRTIAERCLYGVDLNPMAVQLARLSVWLSTLSASKPLGFLDHHFLVGDSLLGAWISSLRDVGVVRRRRANPATLPLFDASGAADAVSTALPVRFALSDVPNDSLDQVREKERSLADLNRSESPLSRWRRIANVWCATRFDCGVPASAFGALTDAILTGRSALPPATATRLLEQADRIAATQRFFHWELEFPEAFFDRDGARLAAPGFDAVLGNPPWDMMRADAGSAASRDEARRVLNTVVRFTRDAGIYTAQSPGHANRYQLFIERALSLTRHGGRIGLVLPWGFLNDQGSARLRRLFLTEGSVDTVIGFENRRGLFPIHRGVRFVLTTSTKGMPTTRFGCRLGEQDPSVLESMRGMEAGTPSRFPVQLTPALLERLSGEDLAIPDLRAPIDLAIVERAASLFPPLGHPSGWDVRFGRELNATEDRQHFSEAQGGLPVVEGKALVPFRVRLGLVRHRLGSSTARQLLGNRHLQPRLAYRDVASSTNRVTLIAAVLPAGTVSTHTVFCLRTPLPLRHQFFLCGMFNSFVVNYLTRLRVTTHVTTGIVERLPIPSTLAAGSSLGFIAACARLLARRDAAEVQAALEARVARLYQLSEAEFSHVLDTFPLVPMDERAAALQAFRTGA